MIIKIYRHYPTEALQEISQLWNPQGSIVHHHPNASASKYWNSVPSKCHTIYEAYSLLNISEIFWKENAQCGQLNTISLKICNPDPVQVVEDKFAQIYKDQSYQINKELTNLFEMGASFRLLSTLAAYQEQLDL